MKSSARELALLLTLGLVSPAAAKAGGRIEVFDLTDPVPTTSTVIFLVGTTPVRWDPRCIPVPFQVDATLDPIPNPLPGPPLPLRKALPALERAFRTWNEIPTSFIDLRLEGTSRVNPGPARFDFVNELTFRPNQEVLDRDLLAATTVTALMKDMFLEDRLDIDEDGDADVAEGIATCRDVDGDGDFELPEGEYPAGTLLDADLTFNADRQEGFRFTVKDAEIDRDVRSVDLQAVATHEMGHSHGLAHSLTDQIGDADGTGALLFADLDSSDPGSELAGRIPHVEDVAASSFAYPEGTASLGPAALQPGDVAFDKVFGVLRGDTRHGERNLPLAGASVFAIDRQNGEVMGSAISGTTRVLFNVLTNEVGRIASSRADLHLVDGRYALPVPLGRQYLVGIEAVDNTPIGGSQVNKTTEVGVSFLLQDFPEELYDGSGESDLEVRPGASVPVSLPAHPGAGRDGIDLVTNRVLRLGNVRLRQDLLLQPPGTFFAVRIPASELAAVVGTGAFAVSTALFHTGIADASIVPRFRRAVVSVGKMEPDGSARVDLARPLAESRPFFGQDDDAAPFYLPTPEKLGADLRRLLDRGTLETLFLVLEGPDEDAKGGPAVGVVEAGPFSGNSFRSLDGVLFTPETDRDFLFELQLTPLD